MKICCKYAFFIFFCQKETLFLCYKTYFSKKSSTFARFLLGIEGREYFCLQFRYKRVVFETSSTYGTLGSGFTGSNSHSFSTSTSLGNSFCSTRTNSTAPISYRSSDKTINHVSTSGGYNSYASGSGSFVKMHRNVSERIIGNATVVNAGSIAYARPNSGATGELDPSFQSPVGDVLLPMLLMVGIYCIARYLKKRKLTKSIQ